MASRQSKDRSRSRQAKKPRSSQVKRDLRKLDKSLKADLKALRKSIAALRRLGLAFSKTPARKLPKGTKRQKSIVESFSDVLSGKAKTHKVSKSTAEKFKRAELPEVRVVKQKLIVPTEPNTRVYVRRGKIYKKKLLKNGVVKTEMLPVRYGDLGSFLDALHNDPKLEAKLSKGKRWAFKLFGNNSYRPFDTLSDLAAYLEEYVSIQQALAASRKQQQEIIAGIELIQIESFEELTRDLGPYKRFGSHKKATKYSRSYYQRTKKRNPYQHAHVLERKGKQAAKWYAENKDDPAVKEKRRKAASAWRKKHKPKGKKK